MFFIEMVSSTHQMRTTRNFFLSINSRDSLYARHNRLKYQKSMKFVLHRLLSIDTQFYIIYWTFNVPCVSFFFVLCFYWRFLFSILVTDDKFMRMFLLTNRIPSQKKQKN